VIPFEHITRTVHYRRRCLGIPRGPTTAPPLNMVVNGAKIADFIHQVDAPAPDHGTPVRHVACGEKKTDPNGKDITDCEEELPRGTRPPLQVRFRLASRVPLPAFMPVGSRASSMLRPGP